MKLLCLIPLLISTASAGIYPDEKEVAVLPTKRFQKLPLNDLSLFKPTSSNWQIVGEVYADTLTDWALKGSPGTGILANFQDEEHRGHLFTSFEHGAIELELEVMMAKESNSGIYLQSRYEVQLYDSWGKEGLQYGYMGGIYQRSDPTTGKGFEGSAPLANASRAPGAWQALKIIFTAPRFDEAGKKIANARFVKVYLNGVLVQDNVEVSGPTRSAAFEDEKSKGPIMLQGNHGPLAFRNIHYHLQ